MMQHFIVYLFSLVIGLALASCQQPASPDAAPEEAPEYALVIHGGAGGGIKRENFSSEREAAYRRSLEAALDSGERVLKRGGTALDAVTALICLLEDDTLFNAGKGAVLTEAGEAELDASVMDGGTLNAGAVAGVRSLRHPILAARGVMERSPHVMLSRKGADCFGRETLGLETVPNAWFVTGNRKKQYESSQREPSGCLPEGDEKFGTVGAVALDRDGNIAAGTSTGGMMYKAWGRIGDSPVIGAGTYADNRSCGVSATGHGEYFIRYAVAHEISARMRLAGESLHQAAETVIQDVLVEAGGDGGIIALDAKGNIEMNFNTAGMFRGYRKSTGERFVGMFGDEGQ